WMTDSVTPAPYHETLSGRWIAERAWPPSQRAPLRLSLTDEGLSRKSAPLAPRAVCTLQTVGKQAGSWCPFGRAADQAGDQRADGKRSLVFETPPLAEPLEILGAPVATLEIACDRPVANLAVRLCDVHPSGESLRVSFGILNLTHRDSHETPSPLVPSQRYQVRIQLNDAGVVFPAGHRVKLALSTAYWPMIWPAPEKATVTILGGTLDLPVRPAHVLDAALALLPGPETATPERPTVIRPGVVRIDRLGLEVSSEGKYTFDLTDDDPLSANATMRRSETISRGSWQVRTETTMQLSSNRDAFVLRATLRAWEGAIEVCHREWDQSIPRDLS